MKEATGELNMTLVTIIAIAAVLTFVVAFLPGVLSNIGDTWDDAAATNCEVDPVSHQTCCTDGDGVRTCK